MFIYILTLAPAIIFGGSLIAVFLSFVSGALIFLFSDDRERGKGIVLKSAFWLFIVLLMFLAFSAITYLAKKGDIFNSRQGEFPATPASQFPPFINK